MGSVRRQVAGVVAIAIAAACSSSSSSPSGGSTCASFAPPGPPVLRLVPAGITPGDVSAIAYGAGHAYGLDGLGKVHLLGDADTLAIDAGPQAKAIAIAGDGRLFVVRGNGTSLELVRYASATGGTTFDSGTAKVLVTIPNEGTSPTAALAFGLDGLLFIATSDPNDGGGLGTDPSSMIGKVLRIDVTGDDWATPGGNPNDTPIWALGFHHPLGIDVDPATGDVWVADRGVNKDEIDRVIAGRDYGWPSHEGFECTIPGATCGSGTADPVAVLDGTNLARLASGGLVIRDPALPKLAGKYVYKTLTGTLDAVDPFGPSGPSKVTTIDGAPGALLARRSDGVTLLAGPGTLSTLADDAPGGAPAMLLATGCFDLASTNGAPAGTFSYDVDVALWSDGAIKDRWIAIPAGKKIAARPDGDLDMPVGTVAVKTFKVDGKRIETRLLVQHSLGDWTGYSYEWNGDGTDATLVAGNKTKALSADKSWYFPSTTDCTACHTPAAGYTLGLEARQLAHASPPDSLSALESVLATPIDRARVTPLVAPDAPTSVNDGPALATRARSYLHANCSVCHRDGSATLFAELDLRFDTPLAATGLCGPTKSSAVVDPDQKIIFAGLPDRSVLVKRMRALDDTRMPKLASHVVDDAGVTAITQWITSMTSCP